MRGCGDMGRWRLPSALLTMLLTKLIILFTRPVAACFKLYLSVVATERLITALIGVYVSLSKELRVS